jgi:hypothetical protein
MSLRFEYKCTSNSCNHQIKKYKKYLEITFIVFTFVEIFCNMADEVVVQETRDVTNVLCEPRLEGRVSGIYTIFSNSNPSRFYIGSSIDINRRFSNHISKLRRGNHNGVGNIPWNKGLTKHDDKRLQAYSDNHTGSIPWNKGKKMPPRKKI